MVDFKKILDKIKGFWSSLDKKKKILYIVVAMSIIVALSILFTILGTPHYIKLISGLKEAEIGNVINKLGEYGVEYRVVGDTVYIRDTTNPYEIKAKLATDGILNSLQPGFELFEKTQLGETTTDKQVKYRRALQGELERTIESISSIDYAYVNIALPLEPRPTYLPPASNIKASVIVKRKFGYQLSPAQVKGIVELVANAVNGLNPNNVSIIDAGTSKILSEGLFTQSTEYSDTKIKLKEKIEKYYKDKILNALTQVYGYGNVTVMVSAALNWQKIEANITNYTPESKGKGIPVSSENDQQSSSGGISAPVGTAGTNSNIPPNTYKTTNTSINKSTSSKQIVNYNMDTLVQNITTDNMGEIKNLGVSIFLNSFAQPTGVSTNASVVEVTIKNLFSGIPTNVKVVNTKFNDLMAKKIEAETQAVVRKEQLRVILLWSVITVVMAILALALIMRRMKIKKQVKLAEQKKREVIKQIREAEKKKEPSPEEREFMKIREELNQLINESPGEIASVIRLWMEEGE
jgi:flagellar M-ring protein FliF